MNVFDKLTINSNNTAQLSQFISRNTQELYDYFLTQEYEKLSLDKIKIAEYFTLNLQLFESLDFSQRDTRVFITLLLDVSQRFHFLTPFEQFYYMLKQRNRDIGHRHEAAALFFIGIRNVHDYYDRIDQMMPRLADALEKEDTEDRIVETIVVFYSLVIASFLQYNNEAVIRINHRLQEYSNIPRFMFLRNTTLQNILTINLSTPNVQGQIQHLLDGFLNRRSTYNSASYRCFLIESGSHYVQHLLSAAPNFQAIQGIATTIYLPIKKDSIFYSLQRGVEVLTEERQLYAYLHSYGKMHYEKMYQSFDSLPQALFSQPLDVIDWGCGQGVASLTLMDYLNEHALPVSINSVTLIEPSEIAIKRAALHVQKFNQATYINTINKDMDSLVPKDFSNGHNSINLHLFSNIIDVDFFSLTQLVELIKNSFTGCNYFICASPYINELKVSRIDNFVTSFTDKNQFEILNQTNNSKGQWINDWTRVVRIFKVTL